MLSWSCPWDIVSPGILKMVSKVTHNVLATDSCHGCRLWTRITKLFKTLTLSAAGVHDPQHWREKWTPNKMSSSFDSSDPLVRYPDQFSFYVYKGPISKCLHIDEHVFPGPGFEAYLNEWINDEWIDVRNLSKSSPRRSVHCGLPLDLWRTACRISLILDV